MTYISDKYDRASRARVNQRGAFQAVHQQKNSSNEAPLVSVEYMRNQVLRVAHTQDDARIVQCLDTARAMLENAYGVALEFQTVTAFLDEACIAARLPLATLAHVPVSARVLREGVEAESYTYDDQDPASWPFFVSGAAPQFLHRTGSEVLLSSDYLEMEYVYSVGSIDRRAAEALALTAAQVYETKMPYAIGRSVAMLPDTAKEIMHGLGYIALDV